MSQVKVSSAVKRKFREAKKEGFIGGLKKFVRTLQSSLKEQWFFNKSSQVNKAAKEARHKLKGARIAAEKSSKKNKKK